MKRVLMCVFAVAAALVLNSSAQAQTNLPKKSGFLPGQNLTQFQSAPISAVAVNGQPVGTVRLLTTGRSGVVNLASGHRVSVLMKNGQAFSAQAVDARGTILPGEVTTTTHTTAVSRTVIITIRIRIGGTVITITITIRR